MIRNSHTTYVGIPVVASNMDNIGIDVYSDLLIEQLNTSIRIFYSVSTNHLSDLILNTVYQPRLRIITKTKYCCKEYNIVSLV